LAALFFFILGVGCIIAAIAMFRVEHEDKWFGLVIGVMGLLTSGAIRIGTKRTK